MVGDDLGTAKSPYSDVTSPLFSNSSIADKEHKNEQTFSGPIFSSDQSKYPDGRYLGGFYTNEVVRIKQLRKDIDEKIQQVKELDQCRETSLVITKLQEAVMWLGMDLKRIGEANPYPSSKDPNTGDKIEPTADGLKL